MSKIKDIKAREIIDSRGNPTVEVDVKTNDGIFRAAVPSGASTGVHEAWELRDKTKRFGGKGVQKAVNNVNTIIKRKLIGKDPSKQSMIDDLLLNIDGTKNKKKLGANAILGVSMAVCRSGARAKKVPLYRHIQKLSGTKRIIMPVPSMNVINGGQHAGNKLDIQEFMILPIGAKSFRHAVQMGAETYHTLKKILKKEYGVDSVNVGDEGGFAPPLTSNEEPLKILIKAIDEAGYTGKIKLGMDVAASEFYFDQKYVLGMKDKSEEYNWKIAKKQGKDEKYLTNMMEKFLKKYPIISIEDPFDQDDWVGWTHMMEKMGSKVQIVGDDLLVTNVKRMNMAIEKAACNSLLLKVNQIEKEIFI